MKILPALLLIPFLGGAAAAQVVAAPAGAPTPPAAAPAKKAEETCPCSDYRFVAKTEKAKAVAAYWDARRQEKISAGLGGLALVFARMAGDARAMDEAQRAYSQAYDKMLAARDKARDLGGLTVEGSGADARVTITLKKGVDYTLDGR
jgi:hypothetical protein